MGEQKQNVQEAARVHYTAAAERFRAANPQSLALHLAAEAELPGGNTRTVLFYEPFPLYTARAQGCRLWDEDGHEYVDFLGEYSAGLYGHSDLTILRAVQDALAHDGLSYGSHHAGEARLARLIRSRFSGSMDLVRFTNSGTEANLMALAAAKIYAGERRTKILVFEGGYHGGAFLFKGGGHPVNVPHDYIIAPYNDIAAVSSILHTYRDSIAAILVEPMLGSGGGVCAARAFLQFLRDAATESGAVLIFDEVMTSRLYAGSGIQSELGIYPDLTTLGKYLGGGLSFGAFGGKRAIMQLFDPLRRVPDAIPHAGTFNNNVLTMRAGAVGLEQVFTPARARQLHADGDRLRDRINYGVARGTRLKVLGCGSILVVHFTETPLGQITSPHDWSDEPTALLDLLHLEMLHEGIYLARRGYMALSLALGPAEFDLLVDALQRFVTKYRTLLEVTSSES